jgi:hypothetical protein
MFTRKFGLFGFSKKPNVVNVPPPKEEPRKEEPPKPDPTLEDFKRQMSS